MKFSTACKALLSLSLALNVVADKQSNIRGTKSQESRKLPSGYFDGQVKARHMKDIRKLEYDYDMGCPCSELKNEDGSFKEMTLLLNIEEGESSPSSSKDFWNSGIANENIPSSYYYDGPEAFYISTIDYDTTMAHMSILFNGFEGGASTIQMQGIFFKGITIYAITGGTGCFVGATGQAQRRFDLAPYGGKRKLDEYSLSTLALFVDDVSPLPYEFLYAPDMKDEIAADKDEIAADKDETAADEDETAADEDETAADEDETVADEDETVAQNGGGKKGSDGNA